MITIFFHNLISYFSNIIIFKLEDGLSQVKTFIDKEILKSHSSNLIPHNNKSVRVPDTAMIAFDDEVLQIVEKIYDIDFTSIFKNIWFLRNVQFGKSIATQV